MKRNLILFLSCLILSSISFAGGFIGKMGPFEEREFSVKDFQFKNCDDHIGKLQFEVEKKGKHHIPRIRLNYIKIRYLSGFEEVFDGKELGETRGFSLQLNKEQGCPTEVVMDAQGAGFIPTGVLQSSVEIWAY